MNFSKVWEQRFFDLAATVAGWSKDPSTKVGCVIVDDRKRIVSVGYNGFARGVSDTPELLESRSLKYPLTIHAEENAIYNARSSVEGCHAFVTHQPCCPCTARLIQNGLAGAFFINRGDEFNARWRESLDVASAMADDAGFLLQGRDLSDLYLDV